MALLKCIKTAKRAASGNSDSSSSTEEIPGLINHGSWYEFDDADIDDSRTTYGYSVAWDTDKVIEAIEDTDDNIGSVLFVDIEGDTVQVTDVRGNYHESEHFTLCPATSDGIDTLIEILIQIKSDL